MTPIKEIIIEDDFIEFNHVNKDLIENKSYLIIRKHVGFVKIVCAIYEGITLDLNKTNDKILFKFKIDGNILKLSLDEVLGEVYEI